MTTIYRVYGQSLASDFTFKTRLLPGSGNPDLTFSLVSSAPDYLTWREIEPVIHNEYIHLYCGEAFDLFRFIDLADFDIFSEKIVCHLLDPEYNYQVEVLLLGLIFSYWLEKRGILALQASAVSLNGQAVAFLSTNAGGKSSLAATLVQMGYPLLSDDILPIQKNKGLFIAHPSFPQMRMWPEVAQHFLGSYEDLEFAHPAYKKRRVPAGQLGNFCNKAIRLGCVYLPERQESDDNRLRIEPVPYVQAIMNFTAYSFAAQYADAAGMQAERFQFSAKLAQAIPVYRLIYPTGLIDYLTSASKSSNWGRRRSRSALRGLLNIRMPCRASSMTD